MCGIYFILGLVCWTVCVLHEEVLDVYPGQQLALAWIWDKYEKPGVCVCVCVCVYVWPALLSSYFVLLFGPFPIVSLLSLLPIIFSALLLSLCLSVSPLLSSLLLSSPLSSPPLSSSPHLLLLLPDAKRVSG